MIDGSSQPGGRFAALDPRTVAALRAVLALDVDTAAGVRERSPSRRRPVPQYGPRLDLGGGRRDDVRQAAAAADLTADVTADDTADGDGSAVP